MGLLRAGASVFAIARMPAAACKSLAAARCGAGVRCRRTPLSRRLTCPYNQRCNRRWRLVFGAIFIVHGFHADVAQLAEQAPCKCQVMGSSPVVQGSCKQAIWRWSTKSSNKSACNQSVIASPFQNCLFIILLHRFLLLAIRWCYPIRVRLETHSNIASGDRFAINISGCGGP